MSEDFTPPYPVPHKGKLSLLTRFFFGWDSWIHTLFEKSYTMKMGEVRLPHLDFFVANEPSLVRRVLEDEPQHFPKHHLLKELLDPLIGDSIFSINGEEWARKREMVNPAFAHTALGRTFDMMNDATRAMLSRIDARKPVTIDPLMTHVTGDIIYRTIFTRSLNEQEAGHIYTTFHDYQKAAQPAAFFRLYGLPQWYFRRKLEKAAAHIHSVFAPILTERYNEYETAGDKAENLPHHDILHTLMGTRHPVTGQRLTYQELLDEICLIFLAGHETSASALTWALYLLANCPHVQQQAYDEIMAHDEGAITLAATRQYSAIRNIFRETLRLYPPISFFIREVVTPMEMRDKKIKKGAMLVIAPWLIQRNKNQWQCPHSFKPERFEDPAQAEACKQAYLPFGKGERTCIGAGFAQQEALIILAHIIKHYRLATVPGPQPKPVSRLTLRPKHAINLQFIPRTL